jgi:hypothetical protein
MHFPAAVKGSESAAIMHPDNSHNRFTQRQNISPSIELPKFTSSAVFGIKEWLTGANLSSAPTLIRETLRDLSLLPCAINERSRRCHSVEYGRFANSIAGSAPLELSSSLLTRTPSTLPFLVKPKDK